MGIRRSDLQPLVVSASFDRPSESPIVTYASGDLVANSTTLANVAPLTFGFPEDTTPGNATAKADKSLLRIERVMILKSSTTTTNASFRVHFLTQNPCSTSPLGLTNADNGAISFNKAGYVGYVDITAMIAMKDGAAGFAWPTGALTSPEEATLYAFLEVRGAYAPASGESFTVTVDALRI